MLTERDVRREGFELFGFQALCNAVSRINKVHISYVVIVL